MVNNIWLMCSLLGIGDYGDSEMTAWEILEDGDELKIIESGSLEGGPGWRMYTEVCSEVAGTQNANLIAAAPELLDALQAALSWIDAVPSDVALPTMPGFDRDWVDGVISKALGR